MEGDAVNAKLQRLDPVTLEALGVFAAEIEELKAAKARAEEVQHAQGELIKGMDTRIRLQQTLIDHDHAILIEHGLAKPRPQEENGGPRLVN